MMMMTISTSRKSPPPGLLPQASVVIRGRMVPVEICEAVFQGGILKTNAEIAKGSLVPLRLLSGTLATLTIHVLEVSAGKMIFRLYGNDRYAQRIWEQFVRDLQRS